MATGHRAGSRITSALAAAAAAAVVVLLVPAGSQAGAGPQASAARYCGKVDIGFTSAKVRARNVRCGAARRFVRRNSRVRRNCTRANRYCRVTRYRGFRCVKGGRRFIVKVRCRRGRKVISETHGD
ncbi:MAG: hypothetical protein ACR2GL_01895 [Thermoleophilaceae bacterium]